MKKEKVVLFTSDTEYGLALSRAAAGLMPGLSIELRAPGGAEHCESAAAARQNAARESAFDELCCHIEGDYVLAGSSSIYRFQRAGILLSKLCKALGLENSVPENKECKSIALAGIDGGAGVSTVTKALARILSIYNEKKVLVINHSAFGYGFTEPGSPGAGARVLYEAYEKSAKTPEIFKDEYGVYYLGSEKGINAASLVNQEELARIEKNLIEKLSPDLTLWDLGTPPVSAAAEMKNRYSKIICIHREKLNEERAAAWEDFAGKDYFSCHIVNMADPNAEKRETDLGGGRIFFLENDPMHEDPDYAFGRGISVISENIL